MTLPDDPATPDIDEAGSYQFTGLASGEYAVTEVVPSGFQQTFPKTILGFVEVLKDGVGGVDGLSVAKSVAVSPDGSHVYATGYGDNALAVFHRDVATGQLTFVQVLKDGVSGVDGLYGANSVTVSPDGSHVYTTGDSDNALAVFRRDLATGQLTFVQMLKDGVSGVDGLNGANSVTVSPEGGYVYATGYVDNALAVFRRDVVTGQLTFVQVLKDGVSGVDGLDGANSVTVSPDGSHVYTTGYIDDALAVFRRDAATGQLTFVQVLKDGVSGVDGLYGASSVTVSPDGSHVYATGYSDNALAVFQRDMATGQLTFVQVLKDGVGGVDGLYDANSVTVSPDGRQVYATGYSDKALGRLPPRLATGQLTFVQVLKDGVGGVDGLNGANSVAASPDGVMSSRWHPTDAWPSSGWREYVLESGECPPVDFGNLDIRPVEATLEEVAPNLRNLPVDSVWVEFSKPVDAGKLGLSGLEVDPQRRHGRVGQQHHLHPRIGLPLSHRWLGGFHHRRRRLCVDSQCDRRPGPGRSSRHRVRLDQLVDGHRAAHDIQRKRRDAEPASNCGCQHRRRILRADQPGNIHIRRLSCWNATAYPLCSTGRLR